MGGGGGGHFLEGVGIFHFISWGLFTFFHYVLWVFYPLCFTQWLFHYVRIFPLKSLLGQGYNTGKDRHTGTCMHARAHTCTHGRIHECMHMHSRKHARTHACTQTNTHTHIQILLHQLSIF